MFAYVTSKNLKAIIDVGASTVKDDEIDAAASTGEKKHHDDDDDDDDDWWLDLFFGDGD